MQVTGVVGRKGLFQGWRPTRPCGDEDSDEWRSSADMDISIQNFVQGDLQFEKTTVWCYNSTSNEQ